MVVTGDPAIQITDADRRTWHDTAMALHQLQEKSNDVADQVNEAWTRFQSIEQQAKGQTLPPAVKTHSRAFARNSKPCVFDSVSAVVRAAAVAVVSAAPIESVRGRIGQLKGGMMSSTSLPTEVQMRQKQELEALWPKVAAEANAAMAKLPVLAKDVVAAVFRPPTQ